MGNNILPALIIITAAAIGLLAVLYSFLKNRKFLYAVPAVIGAGLLSIGIYLFGASSWRAIAAVALTVGVAGIIASALLYIRGAKFNV